MRTDYHTHILPQMDDGSPSVETSVDMIMALKNQGVERIVLTPHFDATSETIVSFLRRRAAAYDKLMAHPRAAEFPPLYLGAEVRLVRNLCQVDTLPKLCMGDTRFLLLELPFEPYRPWMMTETENIAYRLKVVPVLAHVERYLLGKTMTREDWERIFEFRDAVFQFGTGTFSHRETSKAVLRLMKEGYPVVFGSDTHNMTHRPPKFDSIPTKVWKKYHHPDLLKR